MSTVSLLLGIPQKGTRIARDITKAGLTASIILDATISENFDAPIQVTQHPVENGVDISDHVILQPQTVSIEGVISETPFSSEAQAAGVASSIASQIGQALGNSFGSALAAAATAKTLAGVLKPKSVTQSSVNDTELTFRNENAIPSENSRLRDAVAEFLNIRESKTPVTIITGLKQYSNFILTGFTVSRDQGTGQAIRVSLRFQEFKTATSQTVLIEVPKVKSALKKVDQGRKTAKEATGTKSSLLVKLWNTF